MEFKNILDVNKDLQLEVREWRNAESIRKYMYNAHEISIEEHLNWLLRLEKDYNNKIYIAFNRGIPIAVVSLNNIDLKHGKSDWAFYLNPKISITGVGSVLEYEFLDFIFNNYKIEKLNCEVLSINPNTIKLHKKFGFFEEGIRRKNIVQNNNRIDVYLLGILKNEWEEKKRELRDKISKISGRI